jgi:flagellar hook-length control protein FliK
MSLTSLPTTPAIKSDSSASTTCEPVPAAGSSNADAAGEPTAFERLFQTLTDASKPAKDGGTSLPVAGNLLPLETLPPTGNEIIDLKDLKAALARRPINGREGESNIDTEVSVSVTAAACPPPDPQTAAIAAVTGGAANNAAAASTGTAPNAGTETPSRLTAGQWLQARSVSNTAMPIAVDQSAAPANAEPAAATSAAAAVTGANFEAAMAALIKRAASETSTGADGPRPVVPLLTDLSTAAAAIAHATVPDAQSASAAAIRQSGGPGGLAVTVPVQSPQWGEEIGQHIRWMVGNQVQAAEIRINPPQLGAVEVRISVQHDQMNVVFSTQHAQVRDALADSIPRLRDMMAGNGYTNVNVDVSHHPSQGQQGTDAHAGHASDVLAADDEPAAPLHVMQSVSSAASGLIDFYA